MVNLWGDQTGLQEEEIFGPSLTGWLRGILTMGRAFAKAAGHRTGPHEIAQSGNCKKLDMLEASEVRHQE